jgi:GntR family transcriptional regulator / MocR family aminotransferase
VPNPRTTSPELLLPLDRAAGGPLRAQLADRLRDAVRSGRLGAGTRLPSSRALAADLGLSRGIVVEAYEQLVAEGYLVSRHGSGTAVAAAAAPRPAPPAEPVPAAVRHDFRPGLPDLAAFPRAAWIRATRAGLAALPDRDLGYGDPRGLPVLRAALADYLARVRGVPADPARVVVTNGYAQGLSAAARVLVGRGARRFGVEDPGHPGPWDLLRASGATLTPVPVDAAGATLAGEVDVRVLTPAHQFPIGVVMSPQRRAAVAGWARDGGGWVVEDDYDAEYRFDREPVGALAGLAPDHVIYAGSASKSLAPALRIGWLVLPPDLVADVVALRLSTDLGTAAPLQAAFAQLLTSGALDRHLRRTRRTYRRRRDALAAALAAHAPALRLAGVPAGLQAVVTLPPDWDAGAIAAAAEAVSVRVYPMSGYRWRPGPPGLVLGYAALTPTEIDAGIRALATVLPR